MKLELAKVEMRCGSCGGSIECGDYFADGPVCVNCVRTRPASTLQARPVIDPDTRAKASEIRALSDSVKQRLGATDLQFAGASYIPKYDEIRLTRKLAMVFDLCCDERWRTLNEIYIALNREVGVTTISADLRHLRKEAFGSHTVNKRRRGTASDGCFEYQLIPNRRSKAA